MRKIYVNGYYNQWQIPYLNKEKKENSGKNQKFQTRFFKQSELWERQINDNPGTECLILGDFNIDNKLVINNVYPNQNYATKHKNIKKYINEKLINNGMKLINNEPTRFEGGIERGLDHIYSNRIEKMYKFNQSNFTSSDHSILHYYRQMKVQQSEETYILTRQWNKINYDEVNQNIINHPNYIESLSNNDSNKIANFIIQQINLNLDKQSEIRKIKIKNDKKMKYSPETIDKINEKNIIYKRYKEKGDIEDKILLKNFTKEINQIKKHENKE